MVIEEIIFFLCSNYCGAGVGGAVDFVFLLINQSNPTKIAKEAWIWRQSMHGFSQWEKTMKKDNNVNFT